MIQPNTMIIIPGGYRPFQWESLPLPVFNGKSRSINEGGATCPNGYNGIPGLGDWTWPTHGDHHLSGYGFIPGQHGDIDIAIYMGEPIYAADAGIVVYAGWSDFGYGELVVIDHLNGWHTFYGHLSQWNVTCGQQVYAGTIIGLGGSTGNSTGPHLHFEMRYNGVPQDPYGVLP